jgi:hypothetical protein
VDKDTDYQRPAPVLYQEKSREPSGARLTPKGTVY